MDLAEFDPNNPTHLARLDLMRQGLVAKQQELE